MLSFLADYSDFWGPLRLFNYVTFRAGGAGATAFLLVVLFGDAMVRWLKVFRTNHDDRYKDITDFVKLDEAKKKTPSMGGLLIVAGVVVATLLWGNPTNALMLLFLGTLVTLAGVGFLDDFSKIDKRGGITAREKMLMQLTIASVAVFCLFAIPETRMEIWKIMLPFDKNPVLTGVEGAMVAFVLGVLTVVGASNAVNLTDGKDGLAAGSMIFATLAYAVIAYLCGHKIFAAHLSIPYIPNSSEVVVLAAALMGGCAGFLWHNCHPASMFMGDTGSLALGGTIGLIAVLVRQELLLLVIGGVFVMEAGSVMIQVASVKLRGKRVFRCTPIHHHFEKNWKETQIVVRFWILAGVFALIGLATLKIR